MKIKQKRKTPEADLQIAIVEWFNLAYPDHAKWLHHSPNGGKRSISEAVRFKKMGTKAGFPDLVLYHVREETESLPRFNGLAIELKAKKGNRFTKEQLDWGQHFVIMGYCFSVNSDFKEITKTFISYMHPIKPRVKE